MSFLIPPNIHNNEDHRRARIIVKFGGIFGLFSLCFVPIFMYIGWWLLAIYTLGASTLILMSPVLMNRTGSVRTGAITLIASLLVLFAGVSFLLGGLRAPSTPVLLTIPIIGFFLLDRRSGQGLSLAVVAIMVGFLMLEFLGLEPSEPNGPTWIMPLFLGTGLVSAAITNWVFMLQYDANKDEAMAHLRRSHARMSNMIEHLDATTSTLIRSATQFSGNPRSRKHKQAASDGSSPQRAPGGEDVGLTQLLLDTANSSREMIGGVGDTIRGMIAQYVRISALVSEMTSVSSTISHMGDALDKISSRLEFMALNTSLEAARAGEAGKGFLILAEDMRRLAALVMHETTQIQDAARQVRARTQDAINASSTGQSLTDEGIAQLETMAKAFDDMHDLINRAAAASQTMTDESIRQIATIHALVNAALLERMSQERRDSH